MANCNLDPRGFHFRLLLLEEVVNPIVWRSFLALVGLDVQLHGLAGWSLFLVLSGS